MGIFQYFGLRSVLVLMLSRVLCPSSSALAIPAASARLVVLKWTAHRGAPGTKPPPIHIHTQTHCVSPPGLQHSAPCSSGGASAAGNHMEASALGERHLAQGSLQCLSCEGFCFQYGPQLYATVIFLYHMEVPKCDMRTKIQHFNFFKK